MRLKDFLNALDESMPFVVGTVEGNSWVAYYDGKDNITSSVNLYDLDNRFICNIYPLENFQLPWESECVQKSGLAIIVDGDENGNI